MYKLDSLPASKALEMEGVTLRGLLDNRIVVCRLKKDFIPERKLVLEKGDVVVCTYDGVYGVSPNTHERIHISEKTWLQNRTSAEILDNKYQIVASDWWQCDIPVTFQEFKEYFEILEEDSEVVSRHYKMSEDSINKRQKLNGQLHDIVEEANKMFSIQAAVFAVPMGVGFFMMIYSGVCENVTALIIGGVLVLLGLAGVFASVCDYPVCHLVGHKCKAEIKYDETKKKYDAEKTDSIIRLDEIRRKDGWLTATETKESD